MTSTVRPLGLALALTAMVLGALIAVAPPARAATFTVSANRITSTPASDDPEPDGCDPDDCSLREAVLAAEATPGPDLITFAAAGLVALGRTGAESGAFNDLDVTQDLTVTGHADGTIVNADGLGLSDHSRHFDVTGAALTLTGLELSDAVTSASGGAILATAARVVLDDVTLSDNAAGGSGGAIYLAFSALDAVGSRFSFNRTAHDGGAIGTDDFTSISIRRSRLNSNAAGVAAGAAEFPGGNGGAIDAYGADVDALLLIAESTLEANAAHWPGGTAHGGAVYIEQGELEMTDSEINGNGGDSAGAAVTHLGGGIASQARSSLLRISNSSIRDNLAGQAGGGLWLVTGDAVIEQSTIAGNASPAGAAGGLALAGGPAMLVNSTLSANEAASGGGAVHVGSPATLGAITIVHSTIAATTGPVPALHVADGSEARLLSTIIAGSETSNCGGPGTITSGDHNVADSADCNLTEPNDLPGTDPLLAPLADNGGQPQGALGAGVGLTHALLTGSPAIDSSAAAYCGTAPVDVDQRGVARPQGPTCDRGAYESQVEPGPGPGPGPDPDPDPDPEIPPACDESAPGAEDPVIEDGVTRIEGLNRIQTAIVASQAICGDGEAPAVVLTRADLFPDAQAGTPLALHLGAPLLLSSPDSLSTETEEEIQRVLPTGRTVFLLGGTAALGEDVAERLEDLGYDTVRYGGVNRFETATIIAEDGLDDPDTLLVTNGGDFADSVIAGAAAATFTDADGDIAGAVILTSGEDVSPETAAYLDSRADDPTLIAIGGSAAAAHPTVESVVGVSRFDTALLVADRFFTDPTVVGVARADDFADALTGGAVVGRGEIGGPGPILLSDSEVLPGQVEDWLTAHAASIDKAVLFGGTAALSADVQDDIATALGM